MKFTNLSVEDIERDIDNIVLIAESKNAGKKYREWRESVHALLSHETTVIAAYVSLLIVASAFMLVAISVVGRTALKLISMIAPIVATILSQARTVVANQELPAFVEKIRDQLSDIGLLSPRVKAKPHVTYAAFEAIVTKTRNIATIFYDAIGSMFGEAYNQEGITGVFGLFVVAVYTGGIASSTIDIPLVEFLRQLVNRDKIKLETAVDIKSVYNFAKQPLVHLHNAVVRNTYRRAYYKP